MSEFLEGEYKRIFFFFLRGCVVGKNQKFSNEGITFKFFDKKKKKSELSEGF